MSFVELVQSLCCRACAAELVLRSLCFSLSSLRLVEGVGLDRHGSGSSGSGGGSGSGVIDLGGGGSGNGGGGTLSGALIGFGERGSVSGGGFRGVVEGVSGGGDGSGGGGSLLRFLRGPVGVSSGAGREGGRHGRRRVVLGVEVAVVGAVVVRGVGVSGDGGGRVVHVVCLDGVGHSVITRFLPRVICSFLRVPRDGGGGGSRGVVLGVEVAVVGAVVVGSVGAGAARGGGGGGVGGGGVGGGGGEGGLAVRLFSGRGRRGGRLPVHRSV
mmetsp:Transcript_16698/g.40952  ORF Transcript_16698/g.40952 Transcript_16698/m.40952 type:complete len:270 (-) Transcript_16698:73-882(-)